ncbi:NAD(P)-dependent oxidoreductase [Aquibium microcysteis]|uniref:NAD(P)-dependent oxidoreductase n=1 Tax=Aquibium microcysteis TaxID=675281 RepID=UPI00165D26AD|nr:NAD(P)-dependent oxidoreductase [Aquibium microcysteis]
MRIGFIGFGEAGRAFRDSLAAADPALAFAAFDRLLPGEGVDGPCRAALRGRGVAEAGRETGMPDAGWIVSAVTADQSLEAATDACRWLRPGQVFLDVNSVSPDRKRQTAARVCATGAVYVDMAVMAPVHPKGHRTPTLLAGPVDAALRDRLAALGFAFELVGPEPGAATAIKMVRSLFVKGLEAITVEALLAAEASGCRDYILKSLSGSYPGLGWPAFAGYEFERTMKHGARRAAEMRESAATLDALGLHGALAQAIADVQDRMGALAAPPPDFSTGTPDLSTLARLRQGRT